MDRESYEDPEIAAIINQHYVAVKVDRDERPDVTPLPGGGFIHHRQVVGH